MARWKARGRLPKVYCVSLDASKASDKALHHGMLVKLFNKGVPVVLIDTTIT